jgi:hypothetical protein
VKLCADNACTGVVPCDALLTVATYQSRAAAEPTWARPPGNKNSESWILRPQAQVPVNEVGSAMALSAQRLRYQPIRLYLRAVRTCLGL